MDPLADSRQPCTAIRYPLDLQYLDDKGASHGVKPGEFINDFQEAGYQVVSIDVNIRLHLVLKIEVEMTRRLFADYFVEMALMGP